MLMYRRMLACLAALALLFAVGCAGTIANPPESETSAETAAPSETFLPVTEPPTQPPTEPPIAFLPADAFSALLSSDEAISLSLVLADGSEQARFTVDDYFRSVVDSLSRYGWTTLETLPSDGEHFLLEGAGGRISIFADSSMRFDGGESIAAWQCDNDLFSEIRAQYDNLEVDFARVTFSLDGSATNAAEYFARTAYGEHLLNLSSGNSCAVTDYACVEWGVDEISEDDDLVTGWFQCAVVPTDFDASGLWAGNTTAGEGEYEGRLVFFRTFLLQRQDGQWRCVGLGTGAFHLDDITGGGDEQPQG